MAKLIDNAVVPVSVKVTTDDSGVVTITCSPNPVPVNGISTLLSFSLDTQGYRFRTVRAIELDEPDSDFPYPSWTIMPTLATLYDLCNNVDTFDYTVHIVNTITDVAYSIDPEIKNGDIGAKP
jgi:hypothetical protein